MNKPNFFIIGAPKCGTTALSEYLKEHPNIFMSTPKEPWYFCFDLNEGQERNAVKYLSLFSGSNPQVHKAIGEGTPSYLFSKVAVPEILKFNPDAKFIVMLRNPIDMIMSFHSQHIYDGHENILDFEKAWRTEPNRRIGKDIPFTCYEPKLLLYSEWGKLGEQMESLLAVVPRERIKVILFDDFVRDAKGEYVQVLSFLEVRPDGRSDFPKFNENKTIKYPQLQQLFRFISHVRNRVGLRKGIGLVKWILKKNVKPGKRPQISTSFRQELNDYFRLDISKLSNLLGRDLTHWLSDKRSGG